MSDFVVPAIADPPAKDACPPGEFSRQAAGPPWRTSTPMVMMPECGRSVHRHDAIDALRLPSSHHVLPRRGDERAPHRSGASVASDRGGRESSREGWRPIRQKALPRRGRSARPVGCRHQPCIGSPHSAATATPCAGDRPIRSAIRAATTPAIPPITSMSR